MTVLESFVLVLALAAQGSVPLGVPSSKGAPRTGSYVNRKLTSKAKTVRSVALLAPSVAKVDVRPILGPGGAKEAEPDESRPDTAGIVADALRKRGWQVDDRTFFGQPLEADGKLRILVDYARATYVNLLPQMTHRPRDVADGRYSLGSDISGLSTPAPSDALVLVREEFFGKWNKWWMSLCLSLVDPQSGEVLSFSQVWAGPRVLVPRELTREKRIELVLKELNKIP